MSPDLSQLASERTVRLEHSLGLLGLSLRAGSTVVGAKLGSGYHAGVFWVGELNYGGSPESGHQVGWLCKTGA